jgi:hypothetical protein
MSEGAGDGLERFLDLTVWEVENEAASVRGAVAAARTWHSLANLMHRKDYWLVRDLGIPAATSWAVHVGVIGSQAKQPVSGSR